MAIGKHLPSELREYRDPVSGAHVRQLTNYRGHSNSSYFTYPCWYDGGRKLVIASDRANRTNFFGVDLSSGDLTQLTDLDPSAGEVDAQSMTMNPRRAELYFVQGHTLFALDLKTIALRPLFTMPHGYTAEASNATADGNYVVTGYCEDLSDRFAVDLGHGYVGFREIWAAHPHCVIIRISMESGASEVMFEDDCWLGHLNTSPTLPHIMTFCHEGPWDLVDNRIWGLNLQTRETWKIRPTLPGETVGHEYWMDDGEHIGYHGRTTHGPIYGAIRYDNTDQLAAPFAFNSWHFHGFRHDWVVGVGDMSGDVFGNGLLQSNNIKLIAAFDHRHIFIDPDPDPAASYAERKRLYRLPNSQWPDYAAALISKGGGIFRRGQKRIVVSAEARAALKCDATEVDADTLIQLIVRADVDMLYNGGIGTYVRASAETDADVGDHANDACRIAASELRCKIVVEGGNLGLTQRARVEYALRGGRINTDAIDNSAGVDMSDHEVNLKILLQPVLARGELGFDQRNRELAAVAEGVARNVLENNRVIAGAARTPVAEATGARGGRSEEK